MIDREVYRKAFVDSLPVLMGYTTMGFAAGVLLTVKGGLQLPVAWAAITSTATISGALQFMMADWAAACTALASVALITFCLNFRYAMYGFSLLERFRGLGFLKKAYLIWAITDETYALEVECKIPDRRQNILYCVTLAALDQFYWVLGVTLGAAAGAALPFPTKGIDFAMTALFLVILTDQCRERTNRIPAAVGLVASLLALFVFGVSKMLIPSLALIVTIFVCVRRKLEPLNGKWEARK